MVSAITLRLPDELKAKCSESAERAQKTLNKWIINALSEYFVLKEREEKNAQLSEDISDWYDCEYVLTGKTGERALPSIGEFKQEAAEEKLRTSCCPGCGHFTRVDGRFCSFCGKELKWFEHPDDEAANYIYRQYTEKHKGIGQAGPEHMRYLLVITSYGFNKREYEVAEAINKTKSRTVLKITREMLDEAERELEKERDGED